MRTFLKTAKHYWRIHLIVALCTAVATGVLSGALIVGDSMRGSLRNITSERLGGIQQALIADHFFQPEIVNTQDTVPAILLNGSVVATETEARASKVNIYGIDNSFFDFWDVVDVPEFNKLQNQPFAHIGINQALQNELKVEIGDTILLNLPQATEIHPEFLLGTRDTDEVIQRLRVIVSDVIPTTNAGRFSIQPHQSLPLNVYISLPILRKVISQPDKVNVLFTADVEPLSSNKLELTIEELGLNIISNENHFDLQSQQYLLEPVLSEIALNVASDNNIPILPTLTYLANSISPVDASQQEGSSNKSVQVPYSTVLALPFEKGEFSDLLNRSTSEVEKNLYQQIQQQEIKRRESKDGEEWKEINKELQRIQNVKSDIQYVEGQKVNSTEYRNIRVKIDKALAEVNRKLKGFSSINPLLLPIVLNKWTADDLGVKIGDKIKMTYFSVNAEEEYITEIAYFILKAVVPIDGIAADTDLIPSFPGIHDTTNLSDWEPPFPFDYSKVRSKDETYWDEYKATPKAFITLDMGKQLWKNRFGDLTSLRMGAAPGLDIDATQSLFETEFLKRIEPEQIGFQFLSLQEEGINASKGSTDFGMLFSSLSIFIILAAATLVGAIFAIGATQRSREIGILQAVGFKIAQIRRRFLLEGILIATIGSLFGCLLAIGYAKLMIYGLKTWWLPAIGTPFINLHISGWSLMIGILATIVVVMYFIRGVVKRLGKAPTAVLLSGETDFDEVSRRSKTESEKSSINRSVNLFLGSIFGILAGYYLITDGWFGLLYVLVFYAIVITIIYFLSRSKFGTFLTDRLGPSVLSHPRNTQNKYQIVWWELALGLGIGTIVGIIGTILVFSLDGSHIYEAVEGLVKHPIFRLLGSALGILGTGWLVFDKWLGSQRVPKRFSRLRFGLKNAAWQPMHSQSSVIIMSFACCIIVAVGVNRHDALPETEYAFVAESSLPLHHSLNSPDGRLELGFDEEGSQLLTESEIYPFRVLPGEDVSCLNLYKPEKPQILGAPDRMLYEDPWHFLQQDSRHENRIHAIGDDKSLRWILHHDPKEDFLIQDEFGNDLSLQLETVSNSLFQSQLIISESDFTKYFPSQSGYQYFLIKTPLELQNNTLQVLEKTLEDYGLDVTSAADRLASFREVENTYISTFQSLGGLGVLLGTFGLAMVLFRNIIERRRELATLRAYGFRRKLLFNMLFLESGFLLSVGMLIGILAGIVAILGSQGHLPSFPWLSLTITLILIFGFGIIANSIAVVVALRSPLLLTLKTE